jgi:hypothetical protein
MKTIFVAIVTFSLLCVLASCEENDQPNPDREQLVGIWKLDRITGGITGSGYPPDFTEVEFKNSGIYRVYNQDTTKAAGTYDLTTEAAKRILRLTPNDSTRITFEFEEKEVTFQKSDTLLLSDPCCDLFQYEFSRKTNR